MIIEEWLSSASNCDAKGKTIHTRSTLHLGNPEPGLASRTAGGRFEVPEAILACSGLAVGAERRTADSSTERGRWLISLPEYENVTVWSGARAVEPGIWPKYYARNIEPSCRHLNATKCKARPCSPVTGALDVDLVSESSAQCRSADAIGGRCY